MKTLIASLAGVLLAVVPERGFPSLVPTWIERFGWTLLHSIWQFAVVAILVSVWLLGVWCCSLRPIWSLWAQCRLRRLLPTADAAQASNQKASLLGLLTIGMSLAMLLTLFVWPIQSVLAQAPQTESPAKNVDVESLRLRTVRVVDEQDEPVAGAEVQFQFQHEAPNSLSIELISKATNPNGRVSIQAPEHSDVVILTVERDGFVEFCDTQSATGSSTVRLKRGRVVHVRAVDGDGQILKQAVPLLARHRVWGREFVPQNDGTFKSPSVALTRRMMRVAAAQKDGPMLFSELVDIATVKPGEDGILELVLSPGTQFRGRLDDSVPRPITEGYVSLSLVESANHKLGTNQWIWEESTAVEADGTFTFASLPSGGHAQFHVVVDGFMSTNPTTESLIEYAEKYELISPQVVENSNGSSAAGGTTMQSGTEQLRELLRSSSGMRPQWVPLDKPDVEVTVACEKTASCDFRILDSSGNPIPKAVVSFSPNGRYLFGGNFIPGSDRFQTAELVERVLRDTIDSSSFSGSGNWRPRRLALKREDDWAEKSFTEAKSDKNGCVQIRNLPGACRESFSVSADGFVLPRSPLYANEDDPAFRDRREGYVDLIAGETIQRTIYLEREQPVVDREVLVMDDKGRPVNNVTVALAEMRIGKSDWQLWSVQRFGTLQRETTDENGRVLLRVPSAIDYAQVEALRLAINLKTHERGAFWLNGAIVEVPLMADDGVVMIIRNEDSSHPSHAVYGKLEDVLPKRDAAEQLKAMIENPSVAVLRQLLAATKSPHPEPVELLNDGRNSREQQGFKVKVLPGGDSKVAVVLAKVHPADGTRADETDRLPEYAFVFDCSTKGR